MMPIPAGNFGNPGAASSEGIEAWYPLLIGIGGLALIFMFSRARSRSGTGMQGLGLGCADKPCAACQARARRW